VEGELADWPPLLAEPLPELFCNDVFGCNLREREDGGGRGLITRDCIVARKETIGIK
jgi:hypothetical protein